MSAYQPKTGQPCGCRPGQQRDNCPQCEGTGQRIDFAAIRAKPAGARRLAEHLAAGGTLNDCTVTALYCEAHRRPEGTETTLEVVEQWAIETAEHYNRIARAAGKHY